MAGTLSTSAGATSFRYLNNDRFCPAISIRTTSNVQINRRICPKSSLHAIIDERVKKMKSRSLYDVLNVNRNATPSEIKTAYRNLAKRYHPDTASDSKQNGDRDFIDIHSAYATLFDPTTRALYDLKLSSRFERRYGGVYTAARRSSEFYTGRRWETDQCW